MSIKFEKQTKGFSAIIEGWDVHDLTKKVNDCKDGKCSCSCDVDTMDNIENIEVASCDNGAKITITGNVSVESMAPMMQECLLHKQEEAK